MKKEMRLKAVLRASIFPLVVFGLLVIFIAVYQVLGLPNSADLVKIAETYLARYGYIIVLAAAFVEAIPPVNFYFPGSAVVVLSVAFARQGTLDVFGVLGVCAGAFLLAYSFNYLLGKYGWSWVLVRCGLGPALERCRSPFSGVRVTVKPDGFIRIHEKESDAGLSEHTFFFELDRSTETQDTLAARAACYLDYYKSGGFAVRNGGTRSDYKGYPFRVLMVFKTAERRNNIAEKLLQNVPPIFTHVWLTTFDEVKTNPLGKIWIRPLDYRRATQGTP